MNNLLEIPYGEELEGMVIGQEQKQESARELSERLDVRYYVDASLKCGQKLPLH